MRTEGERGHWSLIVLVHFYFYIFGRIANNSSAQIELRDFVFGFLRERHLLSRGGYRLPWGILDLKMAVYAGFPRSGLLSWSN